MPISVRPWAIALACAVLLLPVGGCGAATRPAASWANPPSVTDSPSGLNGGSAAPSASAGPSPSPSGNRPSGRPSTGPVGPRTGKPGPGNTGVVPGTALMVVNGDQTFASNGTVITGKDFHGYVRVTGANITFRNCIFRGGTPSGNNGLLDSERGTNTVVQDSEFLPAHPAATIDGIWANHTSIYRANIHGSVDGVKTGTDVLIQDSYIHDMSWFASDPNQGGGATHNDGVQGFLGDSGVTLRHNTIDMSTTHDPNAALQDSAHNVRVDGNWLDGGGCMLNFNHVNAPLGQIYITNNRFGRHSFYKCPILISSQTTLSVNSGNVWDDTGSAIPAPQQHD